MKFIVAVVFVVIQAAAAAKAPQMPLQPTASGSLSGMKIVLDPGHGGTDSGSIWHERFGNKRVEFHEAGYTYRITWQIAESLRAKGATVWLTAWSPRMTQEPTRPQEALTKPADATFTATGDKVVARTKGLNERTALAEQVWEQYLDPEHTCYIALHIDAVPGGKGGHVCVYDAYNPPKLASIIASHMIEAHLERTQNGQVRPVLQTRQNLYVLKDKYNPIPERMLVELATPQTANDSWRLRSPEARQKLVNLIVGSVEEFATGSPSATTTAVPKPPHERTFGGMIITSKNQKPTHSQKVWYLNALSLLEWCFIALFIGAVLYWLERECPARVPRLIYLPIGASLLVIFGYMFWDVWMVGALTTFTLNLYACRHTTKSPIEYVLMAACHAIYWWGILWSWRIALADKLRPRDYNYHRA